MFNQQAPCSSKAEANNKKFEIADTSNKWLKYKHYSVADFIKINLQLYVLMYIPVLLYVFHP
jgi:hypothetical protein